jgi:hypothetical protein
MLKNWACVSAEKTESQKPTAKTNLAPPTLVAAILISSSISDRNRGKFKPAAAFVTTGAVC